MNRKILDSLDSIPYFTIEGVKQLWVDEPVHEASVRTAVYRWMKSGEILQLKKGVYMSRRFFERHRGDADFSPAISAILLPQSYVSLEFVLQRNAILTEVTYPVTAVTSGNTRVIDNALGTYTYRHLKTDLYHGFKIFEYHGIPFAMASAAKALFDYLYLRPFPKHLSTDTKTRANTYNLVEEIRLNLEDMPAAGRDEFSAYVKNSQLPKMYRILNHLRSGAWRP